MEIRRDPITQSWVVLGQRESLGDSPQPCPFDPGTVEKRPSILTWPAEGAWQVRVLAHPDPLYRIEGDPGRVAEGMYDKMGAIGAHEVVVETPQHDKKMSQFSDEEIERVLWVWASRIADLKKDPRFKYVAVFKNQGLLAGDEWSHAHSQITATVFVPRRVKYELNSASEWFRERERCIFCDVSTCRAITTLCARTPRACHTKFGFYTAGTITYSNNPARVPIAGNSPRC